jgi:hypothetical protein
MEVIYSTETLGELYNVTFKPVILYLYVHEPKDGRIYLAMNLI